MMQHVLQVGSSSQTACINQDAGTDSLFPSSGQEKVVLIFVKKEANKGVEKSERVGRATRLSERGVFVCVSVTQGQPLMSLDPEPGSPLPNSHPECGCSLCWSSIILLVLPYPPVSPPSTTLSATHWDITIW